jgi:hypothetical protein
MHRAHIGLVKRWNDEQIHQSADPDSLPATGSAPDEGGLETRIAKSSKEVALFLDTLQWCVAGHLSTRRLSGPASASLLCGGDEYFPWPPFDHCRPFAVLASPWLQVRLEHGAFASREQAAGDVQAAGERFDQVPPQLGPALARLVAAVNGF